jgi:hypothetical protein
MSDKENYDQRKKFFENLKTLVKSEYEQIFRILKNHKQEYTENSNGIFFDCSLLSDSCFAEMQNFMEFCVQTRRDDRDRSSVLADAVAEVNRLIDGNSIETNCEEHKANVTI